MIPNHLDNFNNDDFYLCFSYFIRKILKKIDIF